MTERDGKLSEHFNPRRHIQSFSQDGTPGTPVTVLRRDENGKLNSFSTLSLDGMCAIDNFYDADDPYDSESVERILADAEVSLNKMLKVARNGDLSQLNMDVAVFYISFIESRSIVTRAILREMLFGSSLDPAIKKVHAIEIIDSTYRLNGYPLEQFVARAIVTDGEEFVTSDNPVVHINTFEIVKEIYGVEENNSSKREGYDKEYVFLCPISSRVCIAAYHKESKYAGDMIDKGYFSVHNINRLMCNYAIEFIFYAHDLSQDCKNLFQSEQFHEREIIREHLKHERELAKETCKVLKEKLKEKDNQSSFYPWV